MKTLMRPVSKQDLPILTTNPVPSAKLRYYQHLENFTWTIQKTASTAPQFFQIVFPVKI